jgi:hypothetical protein
MFIIPYFLKNPTESNTEFKLWTAYIFLMGGKTIWETEEVKCTEKNVIKTYLEPNGFFGKTTHLTKTALFFEIDLKKTNIKNFYFWTEVLDESDVFRPFVWLGELGPGKEDGWCWGDQCKTISLGKFGNALDFWKNLSETPP